MAPTLLNIGIPATSSHVPMLARKSLKKNIEALEAELKSSPYNAEMAFVDSDADLKALSDKLKERKWDLIHIGGKRCAPILLSYVIADLCVVGLRTGPTPIFEKIVNVAVTDAPGAKFAFSEEITKTMQACQRVIPA